MQGIERALLECELFVLVADSGLAHPVLEVDPPLVWRGGQSENVLADAHQLAWEQSRKPVFG